MTLHKPALAAMLLCCATAAPAHDFTVGELVVGHPMAFETAKTAISGGGYLTVTNNGGEADQLIEVKADFPKVMLHTTEVTDGVARMKHVEAIEIPAGETVTMEPGGYHVMFMGLDGDPFEVGEKIPATLVFEKAGEVAVEFNVEARGASSDGDHAGHN